MAGRAKTFIIRNVFISWNGNQIIGGGGEGAKIKVETDGPAWVKRRGVEGDVQRARSYANESGKVTITLLYGSANNVLLQAQKALDYLTGLGKGALSITDGGGGFSLVAADAWVEGDPAVELGEQPADREWVLDCSGLQLTHGALA